MSNAGHPSGTTGPVPSVQRFQSASASRGTAPPFAIQQQSVGCRRPPLYPSPPPLPRTHGRTLRGLPRRLRPCPFLCRRLRAGCPPRWPHGPRVPRLCVLLAAVQQPLGGCRGLPLIWRLDPRPPPPLPICLPTAVPSFTPSRPKRFGSGLGLGSCFEFAVGAAMADAGSAGVWSSCAGVLFLFFSGLGGGGL